MRITSGSLKGRQFKVPKEGVRPTTERTREAVFSSIAAVVPGARVLDLFAGAGSLGLEAWSRGAASVTAVEKFSKAWKILSENFQTLDLSDSESAFGTSQKKRPEGERQPDELGSFQTVREDVYNFLKRASGPFEFDLIFADPPYDDADLPRLLESIGDTLASEGLLVFEMRNKRAQPEISNGWKLLKQKKYGSTQVLFLERNRL